VAAQYGGRALTIERAAGSLTEADVVVASTSARGHVVTRDDVERALRGRRGRPLFLIDIAVPRDVDPAAHDLDGCFVYDIDDLEAVVAESMPGRAGETERAEVIAATEAERFRRWRAARDVAPAIASLRTRAEEIRAGELSRVRGRLAGLSEAERAVVEAMTTRIVDKLLHVPTMQLKEAAAGSSPGAAAQAFRDLFQLDDDADSDRDAR
jgi:glutamyl-tRNA reductase